MEDGGEVFISVRAVEPAAVAEATAVPVALVAATGVALLLLPPLPAPPVLLHTLLPPPPPSSGKGKAVAEAAAFLALEGQVAA